MCKLLLDFPVATINYVIQACGVLQKTFSPFKEIQGLEMYYTMNDHQIR